MMHLNSCYRIGCAALLLACLVVGSGTSMAQQRQSAKQRDVVAGPIEWVDHQQGAIVVGDHQYVLPDSLKGNTAIQPGTQIRFRYKWRGQEKVITEIVR